MAGLQGKNMGGLELSIEWSKKSGRYNPSASKRSGRDKSDLRCRDCGGRGHSARDCKRGRRRSRSRDHNRRRKNSSEPKFDSRSSSPIRPPKDYYNKKKSSSKDVTVHNNIETE